MERMTGIDFLLNEYVDKILTDKSTLCLTTHRDDIEKHLRDKSLYFITNNFIENELVNCGVINSKLIIELAIIFDIIINNTYKLLISPDDTNFQLFVLILNSTLVIDIEDKIDTIFKNKDRSVEEKEEVIDSILAKMSNNLVRDLDGKEINPDIYVVNVRLDLNKIIISLFK